MPQRDGEKDQRGIAVGFARCASERWRLWTGHCPGGSGKEFTHSHGAARKRGPPDAAEETKAARGGHLEFDSVGEKGRALFARRRTSNARRSTSNTERK